MPKYLYKAQANGEVKRILISDRNSRTVRGEDHFRHNSERVLKAYYDLECEQGSRFKSNYSKDKIKRVHETAMERFDAGLDKYRYKEIE